MRGRHGNHIAPRATVADVVAEGAALCGERGGRRQVCGWPVSPYRGEGDAEPVTVLRRLLPENRGPRSCAGGGRGALQSALGAVAALLSRTEGRCPPHGDRHFPFFVGPAERKGSKHLFA